jgi:subtilisin family serine protease
VLLGGLALAADVQAEAGRPGAAGYAPGRILVQAKPGLSEAVFRALLGLEGARPGRKIARLGVQVVDVPVLAEEAIASRLRRHPQVLSAEVDAAVAPLELPNDPRYPSAWHLPRIQAPTAWDTSSGEGVTVAVLDTGVDSVHLDLVANLLPGWNVVSGDADTTDVHGHGTLVSGTIAAASNNWLGVASIAPRARILPVRISERSDGVAYWSDIAEAITWAADHGAKVANISYGVTGSWTVSRAAEYMRGKGGVVVVAAGNESSVLGYADDPNLVTVSATDSNDLKASWSNSGACVDVAAPGVGIWTTSRGNGYAAVSGTSFASPATAAVVALILAANPGLEPAEVESVLEQSADDLGAAGADPVFGHGRVNAARAVALAAESAAGDRQPPSVAITSPTTASRVEGVVPVDVDARDDQAIARVELYVNGVLVATDTAAPYAFGWDTATTPPGATASLVAKAYDAADNASSSAAVSVSVGPPPDTTPPQIAIARPLDGATFKRKIKIAARGSDDVQLASISIAVDGVPLCSGSRARLSCKWDGKWASPGPHTVTVTASDASGNQASVSVSVVKGP